ncbi:MAG: putative toxin-antitoxin system toxin component, PIN family [Phycisphaerae bacterium]
MFDCNVLVQAVARGTGPAAAALRLVEANRITLHGSRAVLRELRATLAHPELRSRNPLLTDEVVEAFVARLLFRGQLCRDVPHVFDLPRDPDDAAYIDLAAEVEADYLVTRDGDLLSLMTDHSVVAKEFRQRVPRVRVLNPVDFVAVFGADQAGE